MNYKRLIVVLGMHRSGTSAITRGLQVMGVDLGDTLYGAMAGVNEKGFWEDIQLNSLDVDMLDALGSDWYYLSPINKDDVELLRGKGYFLRAIELLRQKVSDGHIIGIKDPRIAKLLPFWKEVFKYCQFDVSFVLAIRHPLSVVKSLAKRDGFGAEQTYLLWLGHIIASLTNSVGSKRVVVDYDNLMESPEYELNRVAKHLDLTIDPIELENYTSNFLDKDLRHTLYQWDDLLVDHQCPPLVHEIYATLLDVASDHVSLDNSELKSKIEFWDSEYQRNATALSLADSLCSQKTAALKSVMEYGEQVTRLDQLVNERDGQITRIKQMLVARDEENQNLNQAITERDEQIANLYQALAERDGRITKLSQTIDKIYESTSWRSTTPLRSVSTAARKISSMISILPQVLQKGGGVWLTTYKAARILHKEGLTGVKGRVRFIFRQSKMQGSTSSASAPESLIALSKLQIVPYYTDPRMDAGPAVIDKNVSIAVHLHLYYTEMLNEFVAYLNNIPAQYDLYVSVPKSSDTKTILKELKTQLGKAVEVVVEEVPNRGRDIAPMIIQFGERLSQYEIIAHIHTKKSPRNNLTDWCQAILATLMGPIQSSGGRIAHIIDLLQTTAKIVFPEGRTEFIRDRSGWADNYELADIVLNKYTQLSIKDFPVVDFPEGSMFWARTECLKDFLRLPLSYSDFPREPIPADGTLAHALERLILVFASQRDGQCIRIHEGDSIKDYRQFEDQHDYSASIIHSDIKVLSYYLPQFHPIPENDLWHGKGFTEWTKVKSANPLFEGHYQQHIPHADIGYYLLDSPDTLRRQAEQMKKAGVHGQVFYHYWFSGKLILEEPAQLLLDTPDIQMPFCFCWANENWTRRWDGNENEILLGQNYSSQDAQDFIQYLIPFFKDHRYIKVEDRPMLFVYRPSSIPNSREYLNIWERECSKAGVKRPYVVAVLTRGATDPKIFGMDAGVERVLHDWTDGAAPEIKNSLHQYRPINGSVLSYDDVANFYMRQAETKDFTYFRSTVPIWDNTARYGSEAFLLHGSTPQRFQEWMESTIAYSQRTLPSDRRFVLVNAWNEWAEGAHLEPDMRYGFSYLNSIGRGLSGIPYSTEINLDRTIPSGTRLHLSFSNTIMNQFQNDHIIRQRVIRCLSQSSAFEHCLISIDAPDLLNVFPTTIHAKPEDADYILEFRKAVYFDSSVIEKMLRTAYATGSIVIANSYGDASPLIKVTENGSVHSLERNAFPLLLAPGSITRTGYKNIRMRTDARCFETSPCTQIITNKPAVTTIIRFHKSAALDELRNALYCLYAMSDCIVIPLIAAQDLSKDQKEELKNTLDDFSWLKGYEPKIHFYQSQNGKEDLRSRMLNESLRRVQTRYAAFLDHDDLLMPFAYKWLINRIEKTGKAVSFGRVYSTKCDSALQLLIERKRVFEIGYSYEDYINNNHAPLHSFMLDLERLDIKHVVNYDDQRYMEDYLLTMQLFTRDNADWDGLRENFYIGDYIHSIDRAHTLALSDDQERQMLLSDPEYMACELRIQEIRKKMVGQFVSKETIVAED